MPELPEVEAVVRGLRPAVEGRTITHVTFDWPRQIAAPSPDEFRARLPGQTVKRLWRRAKYIVFTLTHDTLLIHLKMTGRLYVTEAGVQPDRWVHVVFDMDDGRQLQFSDARKFGRLSLLNDPSPVLDALGPEPLADDFTLAHFAAIIGRRRGMLKPLLLNQRFLAGVGNIYADEALWLARLDPRRKADTLTASQIEALYHAIRQVLADAIRHEGASINWYRKPDGTQGEAQFHFNVYDRHNQPCPRCAKPVTKIKLGQRGTHFCLACQR